VQRGLDPRDYILISFGGAGGLHVCELADALGMRRALAPVHAGVLSALGMLVAPQGRQLSLTLNLMLGDCADQDIEQRLDQLAEQGLKELKAEGADQMTRAYSLDLRYQGQSSTLRIEWRGAQGCQHDFHTAHREQFGHALEMPIELVNIRVGLHAVTSPPDIPRLSEGRPGAPTDRAQVYGISQDVPLYRRESLVRDQTLVGPALVSEASATTLVGEGWNGKVDEVGNLLLERT
jgi:N-methylhydantoinase A